jgi:CxxC motif-containing protein (DUF1111 family)
MHTLRAVLKTLVDGFVEAIDDSTLVNIANGQANASGGLIHGEAIQVPVLEAPGQTRIGRFGWKDQHSSLLSFIGDAYLNEMGITNRLKPVDSATVAGQPTEDTPDAIGMDAIDHFAQFIRGTKAPPRDLYVSCNFDAQACQKLFESVGCNTCHVESMTTLPAGTVAACLPAGCLGNKTIHPFGDFRTTTGDVFSGGPRIW